MGSKRMCGLNTDDSALGTFFTASLHHWTNVAPSPLCGSAHRHGDGASHNCTPCSRRGGVFSPDGDGCVSHTSNLILQQHNTQKSTWRLNKEDAMQ